MSVTHKLVRDWQNSNGSQSLTATVSKSGGAEQNLSETIPGASTDLSVEYNLDVSAVKSFYALSSRGMTIKTNDSGAPADTLVLAAGVPYEWCDSDDDAFHFGTDINQLFITLAAGADDDLEIRALTDPTP